MNKRLDKVLFLLISFILLVAGLASLVRLPLWADEPFKWTEDGSQIVITETSAGGQAQKTGLLPGDRLVEMDGLPVRLASDVQYVFESRRAGSTISMEVRRGTEPVHVTLLLARKYRTRFILTNLLLGLLFWVVGLFVYLKKQDDKPARVFAWGSVVIAFTILAVGEGYPYERTWWEFLLPAFYCLLYPLVPAFILAFVSLYPKPKTIFRKHPSLLPVLFAPGVVFLLLFEWTYTHVIGLNSLKFYHLYSEVYKGFRIYFAIYLILSIVSLIHSSRFSESRADRHKVQWILWAIAIGTAPFIFLWNLPLALGHAPLITEEINYFFMLLIPVAIAFSIVKYHALDIEVIIQRSIVYSVVTAVIAAMYLVLAGLAGYELGAVSRRSGNLLMILFTLAAAALFSPIRRRVQHFVDKHFYKIKYNYRSAIKEFSKALTSVGGREELIDLLMDKINAAIPVNRVIFYLKDPLQKRFEAVGFRGISKGEGLRLDLDCGGELVGLAETKKVPLAKKYRAEPEDVEELPAGSCLETLGLDLLIAIRLQDRLTGFLGMGEKMSKDKYYREDFQLLTPMAEQSVATLERLRLQEAMILEKAEKSKLEELNRLKSEFLSHVSHELRAPLASIRWTVENLLDGIPEKPSEKTRTVLKRMDECGGHLEGMIEDLLDVTRIEAGRIDLKLEALDVRENVGKAVEIVKPLADRKAIRLESDVPKGLKILADRDAVEHILVNLLDNAVKYSPEKSTVRIEACPVYGTGPGRIQISVSDRGIGIPKEKHKDIFGRFERVKTDKVEREKGLGLGLHIVKKLVELQGGKIWVESKPGRGSMFRFDLPGARK
jgi:signal transduction histidine kinase